MTETNFRSVIFCMPRNTGKSLKGVENTMYFCTKCPVVGIVDIVNVQKQARPRQCPADTSWKIGDMHGWTEETFPTKANMGAHIDELLKASKYENNKDAGDRTGKRFQPDSFDHRTAFFRDYDGEYYRVHLSVGVFPDGKVGYSIGKDIQKRSFPQSNGSSSKGGALNDGKTSSNPILAQSDGKSNTFYQTSENNSETEKTAMQIALEKAGITNQYMQDGGKDATGSNRSYSLSENARRDVHNALNDKKFQGDIKLTDTSPSIILSHNGVKNLPMLMNTSHIRENIFTEDEARNKGLKVNENINYHGLGEDLFLKVIEDLDNVTEAYRGTKNADNPARRENYFLLISKQTDKDGNTINIPVFINEKGRYNRVFVDTNKIATVFGRSELDKYIREQINAKNLVRIKNRSNQTSEWTSPINARYGMNTSNDIIFNKDDSVNRSFSLKNSSELTGNEKPNKPIRSQFYDNTIKRATAIPQDVKDSLNPESFDFIPETSKEWQDKAVKNVNADLEGVKERLENVAAISGGIEGHEAAAVTQKLIDKYKKSGSAEDLNELRAWLRTVSEKTRETARALKATDTAWDKTDAGAALIKAERTVQKANEQMEKDNPKEYKDAKAETNMLKARMRNAENSVAKQAKEQNVSPEVREEIERRRKKRILDNWVKESAPRGKPVLNNQ